MRLAAITGCGVALSLIGSAAARAEPIYVDEPGDLAPGYVYEAPAPIVGPGYVAGPAYRIVEPRPYMVVRRPYVIERAPVAPPPVFYDRRDRALDVQYAVPRTCGIDANGFEHCF